MRDLNFNSKLTVKVDGQVANDAKTIYDAANNNVNVSNNNKINFKDKAKMMKKIEIEMSQDGTGRTCSELIRDVLTEMRKATPMPQARPRYPRHIAEDNVIQFPQQVANK